MTQSMLVAALALLTACGDGQIGAGSPTGPGGGDDDDEDDDDGGSTGTGGTSGGGGKLVVTLSSFPALATVGGVARVDANTGTPVALVRTGSASFVALSMSCPHQGTRVNIVNGGFFCPNHGARFGSTGTWTGGQRTNNLVPYSAAYDAAAGTVTIG